MTWADQCPGNFIAHDPQWAKAKELCQLNMEDIRKAKELGLSPRALIKNIPNSSQRWKTPVKQWVRDLYDDYPQRGERNHHDSRVVMKRIPTAIGVHVSASRPTIHRLLSPLQ